MCVTILGITICISKAEAQVPAQWQYTPEQLLEESRHIAMRYGVGR